MTIYDSPATDEQDVIEQDMVIDTEALEVSGDKGETGEVDGSEQGVQQMEDDGVDEQRRRRVTGKRQLTRQSSLEDEASMASSKRLRREATIAAIKEEILNTVPEERPDLEQLHNFHASIRKARSTQSIQASRLVEFNKWKERGVIGRWSRAEALASGGKIFPGSLGGRSVQGEVKVRGGIQLCSRQPVTQLWGEWSSARQCFKITACSRST